MVMGGWCVRVTGVTIFEAATPAETTPAHDVAPARIEAETDVDACTNCSAHTEGGAAGWSGMVAGAAHSIVVSATTNGRGQEPGGDTEPGADRSSIIIIITKQHNLHQPREMVHAAPLCRR